MDAPKSNKQRSMMCKNLRSHEMYFLESDDDETEFHSGSYWCDKTQESFGPDGEFAGRQECGPDRECHNCS